MTRLIGIDPGTGVSSPTGFCIIEAETKRIIHEFAMWPDPISKIGHHRLVDLSTAIEFWIIDTISGLKNNDKLIVCIENFVLKGKGGATLQRLIGAYISSVPKDIKVVEVHNTTMKLLISGSGDGDKLAVAKGLLVWFASNVESYNTIQDLISKEEWDILDSIGLAVAGYMQLQEEQPTPKKKKVKKV